jgi:Fe-S-cluster-containing dehydrogenase component
MTERDYWRGPTEQAKATTRGRIAHGSVSPAKPEFPVGADMPPEVTRRGLFGLLGASAALAGAGACGRGPREDIVPYVNQPPEVTPSVPSLYATAMSVGGYGVGMLVTSHEGRPTKAEGNPHHPASTGAIGAFEQASILSLYDGTRARWLTHRGVPATWQGFAQAITPRAPPGRRVHILLEPTASPHVVALVEQVRERGDVAVHFDAALSRQNVWRGAELAFGRAVEPRWDFGQADVVVALDCDFLGAATTPPAWARAWAGRRRVDRPSAVLSRLYVAEGRLTVTGMAADERLRVRPSEVEALGADLLAALLAHPGPAVPEQTREVAARRRDAKRERGERDAWVAAMARDLRAGGAASLVVVGDGQPPRVHALAHAMNEVLGAVGRTVAYAASPVFEAGRESHGLDGLVRAIDAGEVSALVLVGGDPAFSAPADVDLTRRIRAVSTTAFVGQRPGETAPLCDWFVPEAHFLESWGDARAFDGTASIAQPLIRPAFEGKTAAQILAAFAGKPEATSRDLVESHWRAASAGEFEPLWRRALVTGVVEQSGTAPSAVRVDWTPIAQALALPSPPPPALEIAYFADGKVHDGRFADIPWLQELPDPVTKLTWDNAALVSPATAKRLGLESERGLELAVRERTVRAPVLVVPGMADDLVAIALGYGRSFDDGAERPVGVDAYAIRDSRALWFDEAAAHEVPGHFPLALTQEHGSMEGRPIVLSRTIDEYRSDPAFATTHNKRPRSLYFLPPNAVRSTPSTPAPETLTPETRTPRTPTPQWGMTIDLNACTGCSACVVACMAENNIPVVGKAEVRLGRAMHWLRIDRYFTGDPNDPAVVVQPMLCQHCEAAPCEYVCPVNATVHSPDGLNEMVYNRCVGTRFCSNNCPYKVRRFNFFNYHVDEDPARRLAMNPDVTVRARGVMEKCTYCVQRIREVEIRARREGRPIRDGEVVTACQQTCPTGAIVFGDISDPTTRVSQGRQNARLYAVLNDVGTLPRTRYLARITNPNPELSRT